MIRSVRVSNRLKALLLIALAIVFTQKLVNGTLYYYIGLRFGWLSVLAVILLIALASSYNLLPKDDSHIHSHEQGDDHDHDHSHLSVFSLVVMSLPIFLGLLVPARPLGATAVVSRGIATDIVSSADTAQTILTIAPSERNVLDWVRAISNNPDPSALSGQEADVVGFVYRDPRFAQDQFMVGRFTMSCCVADALAIGLVVEQEGASQFETDTWVQVTGTFGEGQLDGDRIPVLIAEEILPVQQPQQPYLFP